MQEKEVVMSEEVKELVMQYFNAWQKQDQEQLKSTLSKELIFDTGMQKFEDADEFTDFFRKLPPWSKVTLLDSVFTDTQAALLYEGVSQFGARFRVAEFFNIANGKISKVNVVFSSLSQQQ